MTDAIVLEGIDLGRFEIELHWDELGEHQPYRVLSLDLNLTRWLRNLPVDRDTSAHLLASEIVIR